jgi:hypothetical protein
MNYDKNHDPCKVRGDLGRPVRWLMGYRGEVFAPLIQEPGTPIVLLPTAFGTFIKQEKSS